jgi:hypothetical protein
MKRGLFLCFLLTLVLASAADAQTLSGRWSGKYKGMNESAKGSFKFDVTQSDTKLSMTLVSISGSGCDGTMTGRFTGSVNSQGLVSLKGNFSCNGETHPFRMQAWLWGNNFMAGTYGQLDDAKSEFLYFGSFKLSK